MYFVAGGFIVIALEIIIIDGYSLQEFWNMFVYDSPIWMQYISSFFIYYGLLNYAVLFLRAIFDVSKKLISKTHLFSDRTSENDYLSMSRTNMGFYSLYIIIFYSALHILNDKI